MTRRERLMATLRGEPVDRPALNFYEIGGFQVDPSDPDQFNTSITTRLGSRCLSWPRRKPT